MRFGVIFDVHVSDKPPATRKDNYKEAILRKLDFIISNSNTLKYDAILMVGDLFHKKIPSHNSHSLVSSLIKVFEKSKAPIYIIAGNHDILGNITNLWQQPLAVLEQAGVLKILDNGEPIVFEDEKGLTISLNGHSFNAMLDKKDQIELYNLNHLEDSNCKISLFHQMILPDGMKFFSDYVNFSDLLNVNADILIDGHYHVGFNPSVQMIQNKYFINGGALSRGSSEQFNLEKEPSYVELTIEAGLDGTFSLSSEDIVVPFEPSDKVFDTVAIKRKKETKELKDFIQNLSEFETQSLSSQSPEGVLRLLELMGMEEGLRSLAEPYLVSAYEKLENN